MFKIISNSMEINKSTTISYNEEDITNLIICDLSNKLTPETILIL